MPRVVPNQVVKAIDLLFPHAQDEARTKYQAVQAPTLRAVVEMAKLVPSELLVGDPDYYGEFTLMVTAIQHQLEMWLGNPNGFLAKIRLREGEFSPVWGLREILANCPDEGPSFAGSELAFISDEDLRKSIVADLSGANQGLTNGEWKAATVLAGSAIEALLLWRLMQEPNLDAEILTLRKRTEAPERLDLDHLISLSETFGILKSHAIISTRLAKDFRNLIHPGRAIRLGQQCNRATALSAIAALEHVIKDLS